MSEKTKKPRDLMATTMAGEIAERIPYSLFVPKEFLEWAKEKTGEEPSQRWHLDNGDRRVFPGRVGKPPWDHPWGDPPDNPEDEEKLWEIFKDYLPKDDVPGRRVTDYGCMSRLGSQFHLRQFVHPMKNMMSIKELEKYPFPDMTEEWRWEKLKDQIQELHRQGYWVTGEISSIFETSWLCRGQEELMVDFYANPEFAAYLMDKVADNCEYLATRLAQMGVDALNGGDDMGTQHSLMMSLPMLRTWILSRWEKVISAARSIKPDICVEFHTDGCVEEAVPDLMAIGATAINPVQPECDDPEHLKQKFGSKLVLHGTMSASNLTFGSPDEIRAEVKIRMETAKRWGGVILENNNVPDRNTPYENFMAFLDAAEEYGKI